MNFAEAANKRAKRANLQLLRTSAWLKESLWRRLYGTFSPAGDVHTVSFDAFDTLITRPWFKPSDQFAAIASDLRREGLLPDSVSDMQWMALRFDSEIEARKRSQSEETTLEEIYTLIGQSFGWNRQQRMLAAEIEFARELMDIRPIAHAMERMSAIQKAGKKTIVTSDTYFSSAELHRLLTRSGYNISPEDIYASSDHGLTKGSGRLFSRLLESRGLSKHHLHHIGDQPVADGRAPANAGIGSTICDEYAPTRYERIFAESRANEQLMSSAIAGCARVSRLSRSFEDVQSQTIWNVGTNVAAPLLFAYTLWVLHQARAQKISRLYFMSRDGEIMLQIANIVRRRWDWPIDCRYLYASRQSYALAALTDLGSPALHWITDWAESPTFRAMLKRLGLSLKDLQEELSRTRFSGDVDWDRPLTTGEAAEALAIFSQPAIRDRVLSAAREQREVLADYLRQEGLADGAPWAICDVGWRGFIQHSLEKITASYPEFPRSFKGFYFGLNTKEMFVPRERADAFEADMPWVSWILDVFCSAEHGSVSGFQRLPTGEVAPVLAANTDFAETGWDVALQRAAILKFAEEITQMFGKASADRLVPVIHKKSVEALKLMLKQPSRDEAEIVGGLEIATGTTHDSSVPVAPILPLGTLLRWVVLRNRSGVAWIFWPEASIRRSAKPTLSRWLLLAVYHARNGLRCVLKGSRRLRS